MKHLFRGGADDSIVQGVLEHDRPCGEDHQHDVVKHDDARRSSTTSSSVWRLRGRPTAARCHSRERRGRATELDNAKARP